jgi:hypothetical protein
MATETKKEQAGQDADKVPSKRNSTHDLTDDQTAYGGVYLADYDGSDTVTIGDTTVPKTAYAAAGKTTGDRDIADGERAQNAVRIDQAVRGYRSWLETQPVETRLALLGQPVIHTPQD